MNVAVSARAERNTLPFNEASRLFTSMYRNLSYNTIYQHVVKHVTNGGTLGFNPVTRWSAAGKGKDSRKYKMLQYIFNSYDHDKIVSAWELMKSEGRINERFRDGGGRGDRDDDVIEVDDDVALEQEAQPQRAQEAPQVTNNVTNIDMDEVIRVARNAATTRVNELRVQIENITRHVTVHNAQTNTSMSLGMQHVMFATLLQFVGSQYPVWIPGPAGSGKTTAAINVAKALEFNFYFNGAVDTEYKLLGFTDAGGRFHETPFYRAYKYGGVYLFDEVDASNPNAMVALNAALENGKCVFGNGEEVEAHPNLRVIAAANTFGAGATHEYVGRNKLDAATVDRFIMLEWDYDEVLERAITQNNATDTFSVAQCDEWVTYVQRIRANVRNASGIRHVVSPRASLRGSRLLAQGVAREHVINATVRKGLSHDHWAVVSRGIH